MKRKLIGFIILYLMYGSFVIQGKELSREDFLKNYYKTLFTTDDLLSSSLRLVVDDSFVYLCDLKQRQITIFSKSGKKVKTFGRKGAGPGEFDFIHDFQPSRDALYVCCTYKLSVYSKKGDFIKDIRTNSGGFYNSFTPFRDNFIGIKFDYGRDQIEVKAIVYNLLGPSFEKKKEICTIPYKKIVPVDKKKEPWLIFHYCKKEVVYKDRLYIGDSENGFYIGVFDINGNRLFDIKKECDKIKVTGTIKARMVDYYKSGFGENYKTIMSKRELFFPEYIPAFLNFFVDNDKIYVFKFPTPGSNGKAEILFLDLKGNVIGKTSIPLGGFFGILEIDQCVSFKEGKLYVCVGPESDDNTSVRYIDIDAIFKAGYN